MTAIENERNHLKLVRTIFSSSSFVLGIMSVKGKIAHFYNDKPRAINSLWIMAQVGCFLFLLR